MRFLVSARVLGHFPAATVNHEIENARRPFNDDDGGGDHLREDADCCTYEWETKNDYFREKKYESIPDLVTTVNRFSLYSY